MNRTGHYAVGAVTGLGIAAAAGWPAPQTLVATGVAVLTSGGEISPDVDQFKVWRLLDRLLPDELLGVGGPLQHRGVSHWIGLPAAAAILLLVFPPPAGTAWVAWMALAGWTSHLAADLAYGKQVQSPTGQIIVRAGIPLMPWWAHVSLGWFRSSGPACTVTTVILGALIGARCWTLTGG